MEHGQGYLYTHDTWLLYIGLLFQYLALTCFNFYLVWTIVINQKKWQTNYDLKICNFCYIFPLLFLYLGAEMGKYCTLLNIVLTVCLN